MVRSIVIPEKYFRLKILKAQLYFFLILTPLLSYSSDSVKRSYFFHVNSYSYSPAIPIEQIRNDLKGPPIKAGEFAFSSSYYQLGWQSSHWQFSILERTDYYLQFSNATAELLYADKNNIPLENGEFFNINLKALHLSAKGLKSTYQFSPSQSIKIAVSLAYLNAKNLYDGALSGEVMVAEDEIQGDAKLDYSYSRDVFFNRGSSNVTGHGYTIDISGIWLINPRFTASLLVRDLNNRIYWDNQYHTSATITSNTISFDDNGLIDARPALEWVENEQNITQELPQQYELSLNYELLSDWLIQAQIYRYDSHNLHRLGAHYKVSPGSTFKFFYDIDAHSVSLGYFSKNAFISLSSDALEWHKVHSFGLNTGIHWSF